MEEKPIFDEPISTKPKSAFGNIRYNEDPDELGKPIKRPPDLVYDPDRFEQVPTYTKIEKKYVDPDPDDWEKIFIDYSTVPPKPPAIVTINDKPFVTKGEFSVIYGKAKSKKTYLSQMIIAGYLSGNYCGIKPGNTTGQKSGVLFFDTEQSDYYVRRNGNNIMKMAGLKGTSPDFKMAYLRGKSPQENREAIEQTFEKYADKFGLAHIDGVKDLVSDINDQTQASELATLIMKWTDVYEIAIILAIHENKGNEKMRGALGTELINKCFLTAQVRKETETISSVNVIESRDIPIDPFGFHINLDNELPEILMDWKPKEQTPERKTKTLYPEYMPETDRIRFLKHVKMELEKQNPPIPNPTRKPLLVQFSSSFRFCFNKSMGRQTGEEYLQYFQTTGNLATTGTPGTRSLKYIIKPYGHTTEPTNQMEIRV